MPAMLASLERPIRVVERHNAAASLKAGKQTRQSPAPSNPVFPAQLGFQLPQRGADKEVNIRDG
jgi:hypothetical protein